MKTTWPTLTILLVVLALLGVRLAVADGEEEPPPDHRAVVQMHSVADLVTGRATASLEDLAAQVTRAVPGIEATPIGTALVVRGTPAAQLEVARFLEQERRRARGDPLRVTVTFEDADVRQVIRYLAETAGANLILHPGVRGSVTASFRDVPWQAALDAVVRQVGAVVVAEEHGILRLVASDRSDRLPVPAAPSDRPLVAGSGEEATEPAAGGEADLLGLVRALLEEVRALRAEVREVKALLEAAR